MAVSKDVLELLSAILDNAQFLSVDCHRKSGLAPRYVTFSNVAPTIRTALRTAVPPREVARPPLTHETAHSNRLIHVLFTLPIGNR